VDFFSSILDVTTGNFLQYSRQYLYASICSIWRPLNLISLDQFLTFEVFIALEDDRNAALFVHVLNISLTRVLVLLSPVRHNGRFKVHIKNFSKEDIIGGTLISENVTEEWTAAGGIGKGSQQNFVTNFVIVPRRLYFPALQ
jgi:hypothetical protein